ncbi:MAG: hypothetical protein ACRDD7_15890 [Peptostreptococcaceae bacterium]
MKNTANKTIPFKQRNEEKKNTESKYKISTYDSKNSFKVIPYPRYKKKKEKGIKFVKNNKTVIIILGLIIFFSLIFFLDNVVLKNKLGSNPSIIQNKVSSSIQNISEKEFLSYSTVIQNKIKNTFGVTNSDIKTESMHKNGDTIYAQGSISKSEELFFFDMILENKKPSSLVVDGNEYIN